MEIPITDIYHGVFIGPTTIFFMFCSAPHHGYFTLVVHHFGARHFFFLSHLLYLRLPFNYVQTWSLMWKTFVHFGCCPNTLRLNAFSWRKLAGLLLLLFFLCCCCSSSDKNAQLGLKKVNFIQFTFPIAFSDHHSNSLTSRYSVICDNSNWTGWGDWKH